MQFEDSQYPSTFRAALKTLTHEQRDRIIQATEFVTESRYYEDDCGCLIGTAYGMEGRNRSGYSWDVTQEMGDWLLEGDEERLRAAVAFPEASTFYGPEVVIAWCKAECARLNSSTPEDIAALTAERAEAPIPAER